MRIADNLRDLKYVAYLDVLGFKEIVQEKGEKLNDYFEIIQLALKDIRDDKAEIESQIVSDSIILACEISNENFGLLLRAVQTIQSRCAFKNIWLRGAITIGDIHFNRELNIVVGNGLSQAYLLEAQAKFPRVIINPTIIQNFKTRQKFIDTYNLRHKTPLIFQPNSTSKFIEDDSIFVTFLERIIESDLDNLKIIYDHVKSELYKGQDHYHKYLWLKNYFSEALSNEIDKYAFKRIVSRQGPGGNEWMCISYVNQFQAL